MALPQGTAEGGIGPLVFGELLFDCFPDGRRVPGGAPFNVAWALAGFGLHPLLVSAVGDDGDGRAMLALMKRWDLSCRGIGLDPHLPTGHVDITLSDGDARYDIPAPQAWDAIPPSAFPSGDHPLVYHGSLALRSDANRTVLRDRLGRTHAARFFDVNLREPHTPLDRVRAWSEGAAWLKCNLDELARLGGTGPLSVADAVEAAARFRRAQGIGTVIVTAGGEGAFVVDESGHAAVRPAPDGGEMIDTVGAGDAFSAVFILGILTGRSVDATLDAAARFARSVCRMQGATTEERAFYTLNKD